MTLAQDIARRMLERRAATASAKAPRKPSPETPKRPEPAQAAVPPRSEPDLAAVYRALPEVFGPAETPPLPPPVIAPGFRGSCKAICATTGRQCRLPSHPEDPDRHRNERGPFFRTALPGASIPLRAALDAAATHQGDVDGPAARESTAQLKRESRARLAIGERIRAPRKSAHAGDDTSTGLTSIDAANTTPTNTTEAA